MDVCVNDVECDGMHGAGNTRGPLQTGVMVAPGDIAKVLQNIATRAVQPSDDIDNSSCPDFVTSTRTPSNSSERSSNDFEIDFANMSLTQRSSLTTSQQQSREQTQQMAPRPQSNTYSQTFNNGSSATLTNFNSDIVNNGSSATQTNSSGPTGPKYPNFSTVPQRLKSFGATILAVSTQLLSVAGFFLVRNGGEDATRCYHCGIGLRHWSPEDDPWVEHARFSPKCEYLLSVKGQEFVNLIQLAVKYSSDQTKRATNQVGNPSSSSNSYNSSLVAEPNVAKPRRDLVKENAELRSITKCMFCTRKEVSLVFLPCGHLISCEGCGKEQRICRICNASIKGTVRTFMA